MSITRYPYFLANRPVAGRETIEVRNKYDGTVGMQAAVADEAVIDQAIAAAVNAADSCRRMASYARAEVLSQVVAGLTQRAEEFARVLVIEAGKPIRDARGEVGRAIDTFRIASEEATRITGEYMPLDVSARAEGCEGIWKRVPVGPCAFVSPFNFPLNLAAHKIAPAIAAGCSWVLKPASMTPISALMLGSILAETKLPPGAFSILPCSREAADKLVTDERIKLLSFTGSPEVGWDMKARAGRKKIVLELGGNAGCIVDKDADIEHAVARILIGAFYQSGQSCISVQRIFVHESIYDTVKKRLVEGAGKLKAGDPMLEETFLGPLITEADAQRVENWVNQAVGRGARLLCGGKRRGAFYDATLVENVADDLPLSCREAFGPVAIIGPFTSFEAACRKINQSRYGLQAGVFTGRIDAALFSFNELEVGAVVINDVPAFRVDNMPYGGVKDSGLGREGVRFAIEDMTERRLLVLSKLGRNAG